MFYLESNWIGCNRKLNIFELYATYICCGNFYWSSIFGVFWIPFKQDGIKYIYCCNFSCKDYLIITNIWK